MVSFALFLLDYFALVVPQVQSYRPWVHVLFFPFSVLILMLRIRAIASPSEHSARTRLSNPWAVPCPVFTFQDYIFRRLSSVCNGPAIVHAACILFLVAEVRVAWTSLDRLNGLNDLNSLDGLNDLNSLDGLNGLKFPGYVMREEDVHMWAEVRYR